ncbi:hypothetical protein [Streptomyces ardesiacus]|uniref:hypothetical protein n=1 Tax=Streptomyces ardesiacus TaxID=285564 RepID=UPI0006E3F384|nr:hypothetical protein [Streptomyces sp. NBRC 110030]
MPRTSRERAWQALGEHLGFASSRPEKLHGTGPDNLWALSAARQAVIELKTGCTTGTIVKKDMDQLGGSVRWLNDHNPEVEAVPVMLHPSRAADAKATAVPGMRVITPEQFGQLKDAVTAYAAALASSPDRWADEQAVREQLAHHKLTGDRFLTAYAEPVSPSLHRPRPPDGPGPASSCGGPVPVGGGGHGRPLLQQPGGPAWRLPTPRRPWPGTGSE